MGEIMHEILKRESKENTEILLQILYAGEVLAKVYTASKKKKEKRGQVGPAKFRTWRLVFWKYPTHDIGTRKLSTRMDRDIPSQEEVIQIQNEMVCKVFLMINSLYFEHLFYGRKKKASELIPMLSDFKVKVESLDNAKLKKATIDEYKTYYGALPGYKKGDMDE